MPGRGEGQAFLCPKHAHMAQVSGQQYADDDEEELARGQRDDFSRLLPGNRKGGSPAWKRMSDYSSSWSFRMKKKDGENQAAAIGKYLELAMLLPIATMVGWAIGYGLDKLFGTHFLFLIFIVLGTAAGIIQLIRDLS